MTSRSAVKIGDTLFRVEEISWVKVRRLTTWEQLARGFLLGSGILFIALVSYAKGTPWNVEALLGFFPLSYGAAIRGHYRVASSGDSEESYEERSAQGQARPADLAEAMRGVGIGAIEYKSPRNDYYYVLRPERIAWVRPWFDLNLNPLVLVLVFGAYFMVAPRNWALGQVPILEDLLLLQFPAHGSGPAVLAAGLVILAAFLAVAASFKRGVEVAAVGGVRDQMHMYSEDRGRVFQEFSAGERVAPRESAAPTPAG